ncbi:MAG: hypothetical protein KC912_02440 [Proteobacteria bacterium]|nr:hypothetical protein [Pseudomonadota bacterium]
MHLRDGIVADVRGQLVHTQAGATLESLFDPSESAAVAVALGRGFVGANDRVWRLADGCRALLTAERLHDRWCIGFRDVTALEAVRGEERRNAQSAALAALAASVAAELATSVNVVEGRLELALEMYPDLPPGLVTQLKIALAHTREISGNTRALRLVGHQSLATTASTALHTLMEGAWTAAAPRMKGAERTGSILSTLLVGAEQQPLTRALIHLLVVLADEPKRVIHVDAKSDGDGVMMRLKRPGATRGGNPFGESRGFAFSVARGLIEGLGGGVQGSIASDSVTLTLRLPLPSRTRARARRGEERVLIVGAPELPDVLAPVLEPEGFHLEWVASGDEALDRLAGGGLAGVVTQLVLPGCSGAALARQVVREGGPPAVILCHETMACLPSRITVLAPPVARGPLLRALGRRVRP